MSSKSVQDQQGQYKVNKVSPKLSRSVKGHSKVSKVSQGQAKLVQGKQGESQCRRVHSVLKKNYHLKFIYQFKVHTCVLQKCIEIKSGLGGFLNKKHFCPKDHFYCISLCLTPVHNKYNFNQKEIQMLQILSFFCPHFNSQLLSHLPR